jgi:hypothetical protein
MFEDKFIDRLFDPSDNNISKAKFINAIVGSVSDKAEEFKDKVVNIL